MDYLEYLKENAFKLGSKSYQTVYVVPNISDKAIERAVKSSKGLLTPESIAVMISTGLRQGTEGVFFTGSKMVIKEIWENPYEIYFEDIKHVDVKRSTKGNNKEILSNVITLKDGSTKTFPNLIQPDINANEFASVFNKMIELNSDNGFQEGNQIDPLEVMDEEVKLDYIRLLCNLAFSDDKQIDSEEYTQIIILASQVNLAPESRLKLREYMLDYGNLEESGFLLDKLLNEVPSSNQETVKYSMVKDLINLQMISENSDESDIYLNNILKYLNISEEQRDVIKNQIIEDKKVVDERFDDKQIEKSLKNLSASAAGVGVPIGALYFSGSVVGFGAAGLTSGLAAIGSKLGLAFLGLNPMTAGIVGLTLVGITIYGSVRKVSKSGLEAKNKIRESMLQSIITTHQQTLNYLVEDINLITNELVIALEKAEINKAEILKIKEWISLTAKSSKSVARSVNYYQAESILTQVPEYIDMKKVEKNTLENTGYREIIMNAYEQDGAVFKLKDRLTQDESEQLIAVLEAIKY